MAHPVLRRNRWTVLSKALRRQWRAQGVTCHLCERPILPEEEMHVDHIVPVSVAPHRAYDVMNLAPAHSTCNLSKGARVAEVEVAARVTRPLCQLLGTEVLNTTRRWCGDPGTCLRLGQQPCPVECPAHTFMERLDTEA